MTPPKHVYAVGIGGIGVSAIARYFLARGVRVSGSDPSTLPTIEDLRRLGADIVTVPQPERLADVDLLIYTDAYPPDQVERAAAAARGIPSLSFAEALGWMMGQYRQRVGVAGTNGKSTTSAILGLILTQAGHDPSVFVGSRVAEFHGNLRLGQTDIFVAEADEYRDHFLQLHPTAAIITNVELDHVEYFETQERMEDSYERFVAQLNGGLLVMNADDPVAMRRWQDRPNTVTFGFSEAATVRIESFVASEGQEQFTLHRGDQRFGPFTIHIPGRYNVMNVVGAMVMAELLGVPFAAMAKTISDFRGIWRRFEVLNPGGRTLVINDYAHHPTSVRGTIDGARVYYPSRRLIAVFQPHHRQRLKALFDEFATSFHSAHLVILTETYTVAGRETTDQDLKTSWDLTEAVRRQGVKCHYAPALSDVINHVAALVQPGDAILLMGAGDIWTLGQPLADTYG